MRAGLVQLGQSVSGSAGSLWTPAIWLRGDGTPGARVRLWLAQDGAPYRIITEAPAELTDAWQLVSVPVHLTRDESLALWIVADKPVTFWVDDASIDDTPEAVLPQIALKRPDLQAFGMHINGYLESKGPFNLDFEGAYSSVALSRQGITGVIAQSWFDNSDWADVRIDYSAAKNAPHGGAAAQRAVVSNVKSGQMQMAQLARLPKGEAFTLRAWVRGTPGMNLAMTLRQWGPPYTAYAFAEVTADGTWQQLSATGTVTTNDDTALMLQTASARTMDIDDVQLLDAQGRVPDLGLPWPSTPVGTWRLWDQAGATWAALEPEKGRWNFALLDQAVSDAESQGAQIILTLGQSPTWASARPQEPSWYGQGASAEPADLKDWVNYLITVATRYRGRITHYEVWNEPNDSNFYSGSLPTLMELTRLAAKTLKKVDAGNVLISASPYSVGYLQQYLAAGAADLVDVVGYHIYESPPEEDARTLADLRTVLARTGASAKPLWITEGGTGGGETLSDVAATGWLARKFLVELMYGSSRFNWYTWGPATPFCLATTEADRVTTTLAGAGLKVLQTWIVGHRLLNAMVDDGGNWVLKTRAGDGSLAYLVWNPAGSAMWKAPKNFAPTRVDDLFGQSRAASGRKVAVGPEPVQIVGTAAVSGAGGQ